MQPGGGRRAVIYCRISRDDGTALGVARQEADCRQLCDRRGWTIIDVICDNDVSAYSGKPRPGYRRLLDGLHAHTWNTVVVWHPDRLHRSPKELEEFIDVIERTGADVATCTAGDWDLSTPDGRLTARIIGSVARKESEDKSRRLRRKHLELAEAGAVPGGGRRPFGFEADKVTIREHEAVEVRDAVARYLAGESLRSITVDWEERVPSVSGARWSPNTIRGILTSARIGGQREHLGVLTDAVWPGIVTPADVARVRARVASDRRAFTQTRGVRAVRRSLLVGFIECAACGHRLSSGAVTSTRSGKRYPRYVCPKERGGCNNGITQTGLDPWVRRGLVGALNATPAAPTPAVTMVPDHTVDLDELADIDRRSSVLAEMFAAGEISRPEWRAARDRLATDRAMIEDRLAGDRVSSAADEWRGRGQDLAAEWDAMPLERRRAIIASMLDGPILLARAVPGNTHFDPGRLTVRWRA